MTGLELAARATADELQELRERIRDRGEQPPRTVTMRTVRRRLDRAEARLRRALRGA